MFSRKTVSFIDCGCGCFNVVPAQELLVEQKLLCNCVSSMAFVFRMCTRLMKMLMALLLQLSIFCHVISSNICLKLGENHALTGIEILLIWYLWYVVVIYLRHNLYCGKYCIISVMFRCFTIRTSNIDAIFRIMLTQFVE